MVHYGQAYDYYNYWKIRIKYSRTIKLFLFLQYTFHTLLWIKLYGMKYARFIFTFLLTLLLILLLNAKIPFLISTPAGSLPPIGRFVDPFHGFWNNADQAKIKSDQLVKIPDIRQAVTVYYDQQMIPHIFASNNYDLYFSQGYVTAKDRLWQMEFQTLAAAGRISEVIGLKGLNYDRLQRRLGMVYGAENSLKAIMADPVSREIVIAYTAGINAWIAQLKAEDLPLEYKLLDYKPESWTPLKVALLQRSLSKVLTGETEARALTANLHKFGPAVINDLFPDFKFIESPVIPTGTKWNFKNRLSRVPENKALVNNLLTGYKTPSANRPLPFPEKLAALKISGTVKTFELLKNPDYQPSLESSVKEHIDGIGSNNWAIDGTKSADHHAILANDPHLTLSLPSIWYQIQLNAPGINVYGVSLPGAPGVIIGFNEHISWGVTNVGADVLDIYRINWLPGSKEKYLYDGKLFQVRKRKETIMIRGGQTFTDKVSYTLFGPVVYSSTDFKSNGEQFPDDHAIRWVAHDSTNEVKSSYLINRASTYAEFTRGLEYFNSPAQNFAYADDKGHIAQWVNGNFPIKRKDQGRFILDGSKKEDTWGPFIAHDDLPHVLDPPRHFIASANQSSTDSTYPYYLNWNFGNSQRSMRIDDLLTKMVNANTDTLRLMQTDIYNGYASLILPDLLKNLRQDKLTVLEIAAFKILSRWNLQNEADAIAPSIFESWAKNLSRDIWDEFKDPELMLPSRDRTIHLLLKEPESIWFDNQRTPIRESKSDIINSSFKRSIDSLIKNNGRQIANWKWFEIKKTSVKHLLNIDAFSFENLQLGGGSNIIDALTARTGPSWRMVVEPGQTGKAFGVYPGGQSGNPGSFYYDNLFDYWLKGKLFTLLFMKTEADNQTINSRMILKPGTL